jgi:hypothetical protein
MTTNQIYFTQASLTGFASAISKKLGVAVQFGTGAARTDGKTVYLPQISGSMTERAFRDLCGTAIHEAAHVLFDSVPHHQSFIRGTGMHPTIRAAAMNGVLDVADETAVMSYMSGAADLLDGGVKSAMERIMANNEFAKADKCWSIVAAGIIGSRIKTGKAWAKYVSKFPFASAITEVVKVMTTCRQRKYTKHRMDKWSFGNNRGKRPIHRFDNEWTKLHQSAEKVVDILLQAGCQDGEGGDLGSSREPGKINGDPVPGGVGDGPSNPNPGDVVTEGVAADMADGVAPETPNQNPVRSANKPQPQPEPAKNPSGDDLFMDEFTYSSAESQLRGPIQRIAEVDDCGGCRGAYQSGNDIGPEIERINIDGEVFGKREDVGEDMHVAIALDVSSSMYGRIMRVLAVAQSFVNVMTPYSNSMTLVKFDHMARLVPHFKSHNALDMGGTIMGSAVSLCTDHLKDKSGRRVMIVLTDGLTCYEEECRAACELAHSYGIAMIGIAYMCSGAAIQSVMPNAHVVEANDPNELSMEMLRITNLIVR